MVDDVVNAAISLPPKKLKPIGCVQTIVEAIAVLFSLWSTNLLSLLQPI